MHQSGQHLWQLFGDSSDDDHDEHQDTVSSVPAVGAIPKHSKPAQPVDSKTKSPADFVTPAKSLRGAVAFNPP